MGSTARTIKIHKDPKPQGSQKVFLIMWWSREIRVHLDVGLEQLSGPGFFEDNVQDEKVAQVAAKWLGDRLLT